MNAPRSSAGARKALSRKSVLALAALAAMAAPPAGAVDVTWLGGTGDWFSNAWSLGSAPNSSATDVFIDGGKSFASLVRLVGSATVHNLSIDTGDTLNIANASLLTLSGSSLLNNGNLSLTSADNWTGLRLTGDTVFTGSGTTTLSGAAAFINGSSSATRITIDSGYTVRVLGRGLLGYDPSNVYALGAIVNRGTVLAESGTLELYSSSFDNTAGSVQVASGVGLYTGGGTSFNNAGSVVKLVAGATLVNGGSFSGGTIQASGNARLASYFDPALSGKERLVNGTYADINIDGTANLANGDHTQLTGTINGSLNLAGSSNWTGLRLAGDTLLTGNGTTTLGGDYNTIAASSGSSAKLTVDTGYTLRGAGHLGADPSAGTTTLSAIVNRGTVIADGGTLALYGSLSGSGSLVAKAASTLSQQGGSVQTHLLDLSAGGSYQLASGILEADKIVGAWSQTDGTFAAGVGLSAADINGNYTAKSSATLALNLGDGLATAAHDSVHITGAASLANAHLNLSANAASNGAAGFVAHAGDVFALLTVDGSRSGQFAGLAEGASITLNGQQLFLTYLAGDGNDVALVSTLTPGSVNIAAATSTSDAYVTGVYASPNSPGGQTVALNNLDILPGSSFTLGVNDTLALNGGNGTLSVSQGAVFTGNGVIKGHVLNAGLVRIPIVALSQVTGGRVQIVSQPVITSSTPVVVNAGTFVGFSPAGGGGSSGGSGGGSSGGAASAPGSVGLATPQVITLAAPAPVVRGTFAVDASLEVTGSYTQESTGALRLFVGGNTAANFGPSKSGGTYSQLLVGEQVSLDGDLQVVLQPELFAQFSYTPHVGDTFDFVTSAQGISLASGLSYHVFVTAAGKDLLSKSLSLSHYSSGLAGDPDDLYAISQTIFSFALVDGGKVLRGTLVDPLVSSVPEPESYAMLLAGLGMLAWMKRRRRPQPAGPSLG